MWCLSRAYRMTDVPQEGRGESVYEGMKANYCVHEPQRARKLEGLEHIM